MGRIVLARRELLIQDTHLFFQPSHSFDIPIMIKALPPLVLMVDVRWGGRVVTSPYVALNS